MSKKNTILRARAMAKPPVYNRKFARRVARDQFGGGMFKRRKHRRLNYHGHVIQDGWFQLIFAK